MTAPPDHAAEEAEALRSAESPESRTRKRPGPRGSAAYARKRAVTACQVCRARRTKCDNKKPACSFCEKIGAKCVTTSMDFSTFDPASLKILERLERIEGLLESQPRSHESTSRSPRGETMPVYEMQQDFHCLRIAAPEVLSWPVFEGRWAMQAKSIAVLRRKVIKQSPKSSDTLESFLGNPTASKTLVANFIQHVHIKNPILELSNLNRMVQHACLEGLGWDPESCLVLLVWALGAISNPFSDPRPYEPGSLELGASLFSAATKRLGIVLAESSILSAQCFFYAGVYLMSILQPVPAWRHFLQALAFCQEFDFAIQASQSTQSLTSPSESSPTEQRLYWSCWKSEVELRMCLGLFDFQTQGRVYPGHFPSPPPNPDSEDRAWFFYLAEISLRRLNTRARNDIGRILSSEEEARDELRLVEVVASYDQQAEAWLTSLPDTISLRTEPEKDDILKFILRCHFTDFYELIFWPFVARSINQKQRVAGTDSYTQRGLGACIDRINTAGFGFTCRHHGTWLLLQSCVRSAMVLLAAVYSQNVQELVPTNWADSVCATIEMLQFWEGEDTGAADELLVIRQLQKLVSTSQPANNHAPASTS